MFYYMSLPPVPCNHPTNEVTMEEAEKSVDSYENSDYDYSDYYYYQQVNFNQTPFKTCHAE